MKADEKYMRRALQLAKNGQLHASPNPMVGAVIVDKDGDIIGEGYHRRCGEGHAEVNALASVTNKEALLDSTMYVTLEPCAHYGRTGPCSKLIIDNQIPRVIVGTRDPFDKVDGRGIEMLRAAGVKVEIGMLEKECQALNAHFFTAHTLHRPFVLLKWAQSADGWLDCRAGEHDEPIKISTPVTQMMVHKLRSQFDAILVGSGTVLADNPMLDNRYWAGHSPRPVILDRRGRVGEKYRIMKRNPIVMSEDKPLAEILTQLYALNITSLIVEGGAEILQSFIDNGLWDVIRIETSPQKFGKNGRAKAPNIGNAPLVSVNKIDANIIQIYSQNPFFDVKNL